jgi:hypothetical protein
MEGLKTPVSVIWHVIKARTEGMGLQAAARTFDKAKQTILAWERKCLDLQQVLFLYAFVHEFLASVLLMDRASRFMWELDGGKKDRRLTARYSHLATEILKGALEVLAQRLEG